MSNQQLQQWLEKLEIRSGRVKLGLDNIQSAAQVLNLGKPARYVITVAGTNGKGSVTKLLEHLFTQSGFKTAAYTSPHLISFNERIAINKQPVSAQEIVASFEKIEQILNHNNVELTYFEFITAAAWNIFCSSNIDVAILEVGLGGRLDAVNAIPKDLAIITSIDYDHQSFLGDTLDKIGYEKAGIITENKPVILGDSTMPESVHKQADSIASMKYQLGRDYSYNDYLGQYNLSLNPLANLKTNNIATAIKAFEIGIDCIGGNSPADIISSSLKNFNILGRCSWLDESQTILLDVAHNKQSIHNLAHKLEEISSSTGKKIIAVCGMLKDKDIDASLKPLINIISEWHLVTIPDKRGETAQNLLNRIRSFVLEDGSQTKIDAHTHNELESLKTFVANFISLSRKNLNNDCILVIFGSFYIVGPIINYMQEKGIL